MKKPIFIVISGFVLFMVLFMSLFYLLKFPEKILYDRIVDRNGYTLHREEEPVTLRFFIKPEWIDQQSEEAKELNIELLNQHGTNLTLTYIINRTSDLYFDFHPEYQFKEAGGEFLYNAILNEDGSVTTGMGIDEIVLYDLENHQIPVGQRGQGPESDFGFGIERENWDSIKNGFFVEYSGYHIYKYVRN